MPSFDEEQAYRARGYRFIAGIDEAGRGALAGPVVAGAVILPSDSDLPFMSNVRDSKKLTARQRDILFDEIMTAAVATGIGVVDFDEIDRIGILRATRVAMRLAIERLSPQADFLLIDHLRLPDVTLPQKGITHGDDLSYSIACASIMAKVTRDRIMVDLDTQYSGYGLSRHKGYGTRLHVACLRELGPSPIHRMSFAPLRQHSFEDLV